MVTFLPSYIEVREPLLQFHSVEENYRTDNPIEGLQSWGPYDASVTGSLRPNPLRVAVIAPDDSFQGLSRFLDRIAKGARHTSRDEYVVDWPGFRSVFLTNIEFPPDSNHRLVRTIREETIGSLRASSEPEIGFLELLKDQIRSLLSFRHEFHVILIHIPARWADFRERVEENYEYDLHDSLKVFGAPNNITIQIVEERSLTYQDQARVMWWLALALYVKGGGIPWKLDQASTDTAFVGLSYGISRANPDRRIIMGCSQVFDEYGQGLKFLLHPIEQPIWKGRNPFMSAEDARRLFGSIRETYQNINGKRPRRLVVHKTLHFTREEMDGLATALSGIEEIELLQIQQNLSWRAIASDENRNHVSAFPVKRGTALPLDRYSFLLWSQGDVPGIAARGRHYYQEARGIPSPLLIRRFRGTSSLKQTAHEVLQLTKMNWNNHQLYDRLPVTLTSAGELAKIAKQVRQVWRTPYDFRFYM